MGATVSVIHEYARRVCAGEVPAGKYHRLSCARHLKDLERVGTPGFPYRFDIAKAERFFRFAENLKHYKGEWAGQLIRLEPHQKFRKGSKYGWVHATTGLRRFRNSYEEIPRKNGKSLELATETLYLTFFDGEGGAEGYCAATKREQALIVFGDCKKLVQSSGLKGRLKVQVSNIHHVESASKLEPLSADYNSMDGLNIHTACLDELHAMKTRGTIDVVETATGARSQPMVNKITTAGDDPVSPCGDEHDYACKVLDGVIADESYFAFIAHADEGDDWTSPETAAKSNPNYGVSVKPDDLMSKVIKAKGIPAAAATYKQKHLNMWVNATAPCLSVDGWRKGQSDQSLTAFVREMEHESCFVGVDLASKIDLCALAFVFPPAVGRASWRVLQFVWTPEDTLIERAHRDRAPYQTWVDKGWLQTSTGTRVDHAAVRETLAKYRGVFDIERIGFDPWHADKLIDELANGWVDQEGTSHDGFGQSIVLAVPQTFAGMSSACLRMQAEILAGNVDARGCPVTAWSVSNTVGQRDGKDNLMFVKGKSRGRIDPVIAPTIAMSLALKMPVERPASLLAEWI
jgi:phage terminase large subunit-like protein